MLDKQPRVFQALDLDRTLFDTKKLEEVSYRLVAELHPDVSVKAAEQSALHIAQGTSFFIFRFLREELGAEGYAHFVEALKESTPQADFLLPGVQERLAYGQSREGWSTGILTFGLPEDQYLKMELSGLTDIPYLSTTTPDKGQVIGSWQQPSGTFVLPEEFGSHEVDIVTLDDDKPGAFLSMPANSIGVLVVGKSVTVGHGIPEYASQVGIVADLEESIAYLDPHLTGDITPAA